MKAKMPCTLALALLENQAVMAAGTFNSSLAPFSIVRSRPGSGGLLSSYSVPCNRWGMKVCGSGEQMEILKTLQKQELLARVEHAVTALFVVRKAGEKQC
jgi:hypothetical protein